MCRYQHQTLKLFLWLCLICSSQQHQRDKRIAGGREITSGYRSIVVSLRARSEQMYFGDSHFCSGCMLNDVFVLTSAQCVTNRYKVALQPRDFILMGGNIYRLNSSTGAIPMVVDFLTVHVNFTMTSYSDIAILRTERYKDGYYARRIDVAVEMIYPPPFGAKCVTLGWGRLFNNGPLASEMMELEVTLYTQEFCRSILAEMKDDMICAGNVGESNAPVGPCPGDTGGPLFCNGILTGIVSHALGCGQRDLPTIYTNVYHHRDWIFHYMDRGGQAQLQSQLAAIFLALLSLHSSIVC